MSNARKILRGDNVNVHRAAANILQAEKAARPAAPCATYCYHAIAAYSWGDGSSQSLIPSDDFPGLAYLRTHASKKGISGEPVSVCLMPAIFVMNPDLSNISKSSGIGIVVASPAAKIFSWCCPSTPLEISISSSNSPVGNLTHDVRWVPSDSGATESILDDDS